MGKLTVINLFAGPGAGKSTTAAGLFHLMKIDGYNVELINEYAKELTWEKRFNVLADQVYIFAKQHRKQARLVGQVDYVVTDSPLLLSLLYTPEDYPVSFRNFVLEMWDMYDNRNFFIERMKPYVQVGRNQTEEEAKEIDIRTKELLHSNYHDFVTIGGNTFAPETILDHVINETI